VKKKRPVNDLLRDDREDRISDHDKRPEHRIVPKDRQNVPRLDKNRIQRKAACGECKTHGQRAPVAETVQSESAAIEGLVAQKQNEASDADGQHYDDFVSRDEISRQEKRHAEKNPGHLDPSNQFHRRHSHAGRSKKRHLSFDLVPLHFMEDSHVPRLLSPRHVV